MKKLPTLNPGDSVDIIAPAYRCTNEQLRALINLLTSWQLNCIVPDNLFGEDLLCANTDEIRYQHLKNALLNPKTKAIICARGGYGSMRLIPALTKLSPSVSPKIFVGMSDTTALQLYLQQHWQWPTIHGAPAPDRFSKESVAAVKSILFGEVKQIEYDVFPLNEAAKKVGSIKASITGGNLCLIQAGIGTIWQLDGKNKIILLEDWGERGYRIDRMLAHLQQAAIFKDAAAILFGDFLEGKESDGSSLIEAVLKRFAENCDLPVVQVKNIGHGHMNFPLPLGTAATLQLGNQAKLTCLC